jgi:hypothetical protein
MADEVGGIRASVGIDDSTVDPALAKIKAAMDETAARMKALTASFGQGEMAAAEFAREMGKLEASQRSYQRAAALVTPAVGAATASTRQLGNSVLYASNAFQDFSAAGMRGVTNNIPQLVMALGGGAGLAGTMMVVGMGVQALEPMFGRLAGAVGDLFGQLSDSPVETAAQEMDRLGKATHRTADEQERLNKLKKEAQQDEQQRNARPEAEKATGAAFGKAITEGPIEKVEGILKQKLRPAPSPVTDADVEAVIGPERMAALQASRGAVGLAPGRAAEARKQLEGAREREATAAGEAEARRILREAQFGVGSVGEAARKRLAEAAAATPELPDRFRKNIAAAAAGQPVLTAKEAEKAETDSLIAAAKRGIQARKEIAGEIDEMSPETKARHAAEDRFEKEGSERAFEDAKRKEAEAKEGEDVDQQLFDDALAERKAAIRRRDARIKGEKKDDTDFERLTERGEDLNFRLRLLMNPTKVSQSMGLDQYERSFKATTGISGEEKKLHAIHEVLKDMRQNNDKVNIIGVKRP